MTTSLKDPNTDTPSASATESPQGRWATDAAVQPWYSGASTQAMPRHLQPNLHDIPCAAGMSAKHYTRRSRVDGSYDRATWLLYEGNHVRCLRKATCYLGNARERYAVCDYHGSRTQLYVWVPTGPNCELECCTGVKADMNEGTR